MSKLKKPISLETTFDTYSVDEVIGEGGAGRVYGGVSSDGSRVAVKVLSPENASNDKRRRFRNEIAFLTRNKHANIVTVIDHGIAASSTIVGPFYVMRRYTENLRTIMQRGIAAENVMPLFSQILDGVEALHLQRVVHRDLKPENILYDAEAKGLAIADFGIASFTDDLLATLVKTTPNQRLANFMYAAPEQRTSAKEVTSAADIYALGLIWNEMFTGEVPYGTDYRLVAERSPERTYLDDIIADMLKQAPKERPATIAEIKGLIQRYEAEAVSLQRLSTIKDTVVKSDEIDDPLALEPPRLIDFDWDNGQLTLILDRPVSEAWARALRQIGSYTCVMGIPPTMFEFRRDRAIVPVREESVQGVIDHLKQWLPIATREYKYKLEQAVAASEALSREELRRLREAEERRLRVLRDVKI